MNQVQKMSACHYNRFTVIGTYCCLTIQNIAYWLLISECLVCAVKGVCILTVDLQRSFQMLLKYLKGFGFFKTFASDIGKHEFLLKLTNFCLTAGNVQHRSEKTIHIAH